MSKAFHERSLQLRAQTFSNFLLFPMIFVCGLFSPIDHLPRLIRPLSYALPLTYGAYILHGSLDGSHLMSFAIDFAVLIALCLFLFAWSLRNIKLRWIF